MRREGSLRFVPVFRFDLCWIADRFFGNIQKIMSAGVDDRRLSVMADTFEIKAIALVNMSVTHVLRVILVHYVEESGKARMRQILVVAQIQRGRMRQQDVDAAASPELKAQTADPRTHLLFGILVDAFIIAHFDEFCQVTD